MLQQFVECFYACDQRLIDRRGGNDVPCPGSEVVDHSFLIGGAEDNDDADVRVCSIDCPKQVTRVFVAYVGTEHDDVGLGGGDLGDG